MSEESSAIEYGTERHINFRIEWRTLRPFGPNLFIRDSEEEVPDYFARVKGHQLREEGALIFRDRKMRTLHTRIRPRLGLEVKSETFDILEDRPKKMEYHLGAMRLLKTGGMTERKWVLLNWDEHISGTFVEEGLVRIGIGKIRNPKSIWRGLRYSFFSGENRVGAVLRRMTRFGILTTAQYDLEPVNDDYVDLLRAATAFLGVIPG